MAVRTRPVGGLAYYGGKHPATARCRWISATIGATPPGHSYIEPFAGMLGVLLARPAGRGLEIANDANGWVVSWWRAIRDHADEFGRLLARTPYSRALYEEAVGAVRTGPCSGDLLRDALTLHVCVEQSMQHGPVPSRGSWGVTYKGHVGTLGAVMTPARVDALAARLHRVQLECRDACAILERTRRLADALIYVDPPYRTANHSPYGEAARRIDWGRLADLLAAQTGRVAVSGYGDEWDALGWHHSELADWHRPIGVHAGASASPRREVLWTNFPPAGEAAP